MRQIKINIRGKEVKVEVEGANGTECLEFTEFLENIRGAHVVSKEMKVETYDMSVPAEVQIC